MCFRALWIYTTLKLWPGIFLNSLVLEPSGFTLLSNYRCNNDNITFVLEPSGFTLLSNKKSENKTQNAVLEPSGFTLLSNQGEAMPKIAKF